MKSKLLTCLLFIFLFYFNQNSFSQTESRRKGYVDLHTHTTMKRYYNNTTSAADSTGTELRKSNWDSDKPTGKTIRTRKNGDGSNFKNYSQASYDLLASSNATILCTSITPIEKKFASDKKVWIKLSKYVFRFKLKMSFITRSFVTGMKKKRLLKLGSEDFSSFDEFYGEYLFNKNLDSTDTRYPGKTIVLAKNNAHLQQLYKEHKTALVMTIEGGHVLHGKRNARDRYYDRSDCDAECDTEIMENVYRLKNLEHRVFFINLGHFAWNKIAGFAKTLDMAGTKMGISLRDELESNSLQSDQFRRTIFTKYGEGIIDTLQFDAYEKILFNERYDTTSLASAEKLNEDIKNKTALTSQENCHCLVDTLKRHIGWKVVEALLDTVDGKHPIYVDLKHLDYQGRLDYLNYLTEHNRKDVPVIAGHCAINGKSNKLADVTAMCPFPDSYQEITTPGYFYQSQLQNRPGCISNSDYQPLKSEWFYPWSINLFDEEISEIISRDGIIGITLEERVLGKDMPNYETQGRDTSGKLIKHKDILQRYFYNKGYPLSKIDSLIIAEPFLRNMFYMVEYSCTAKENCDVCNAWNHLAIGSDYDGMMNPIDICPTSADIPNFQRFLECILVDYAAFINKSNLLCDKTPAQLMDKVFFDNGEKFILKYFQQ